MAKDRSFEVIVRRKTPFLTDLVYDLLMLCAIVLFILCAILFPTDHQADATKFVYPILELPDLAYHILTSFCVVFLVLLVVLRFSKTHKTAILTFMPDEINITGEKFSMTIPVNSITTVFCMDEKRLSGESKEKMTFVFEQKNKKGTRTKLKYYSEVDDFMDYLCRYESLKLQFFDFNVSSIIDEE